MNRVMKAHKSAKTELPSDVRDEVMDETWRGQTRTMLEDVKIWIVATSFGCLLWHRKSFEKQILINYRLWEDWLVD